MAEFVSGSQVYGVDFPPSQYDQDWTTQANITTTSYVAGNPEVGVSITAPTSGKVMVAIGAGVRNNANPATDERVVVTYEVLEYTYQGNFSLETGLTPGRQYFFRVKHRSIDGEGVADIASRNITVWPVP